MTALRSVASSDDLYDCVEDVFVDGFALGQRLATETLVVDQAQEHVLGADVGVNQFPGFILGENNDTARAVGEAFKHGGRFRRG